MQILSRLEKLFGIAKYNWKMVTTTRPVFVHLGRSLPRHLEANILRTLKLFPDRPPFLIANSNCVIPARIKNAEIEIIYTPEVVFESYRDHPNGDFRQGFWQLTFSRIFVLDEFHKKINSPILHVESDVLLMQNFPWSVFDSSNKMSWMKVSHDHDIAALVFSPNSELTSKLVDELKLEILKSPGLTDMTGLSLVAPKLGSKFNYLPSCPPVWARSKTVLDSLNELDYGGFFDPAAIGIWNFGQDPRNHFGISRMHIDPYTHEINPSKIKIRINEFGELTDQFGNLIFNLHIHSKDILLFEDINHRALMKAINNSSMEKPKSKFYFNKFLSSLNDYPFPKNVWVLLVNFKLTRKLVNYKLVQRIKSYYKDARN